MSNKPTATKNGLTFWPIPTFDGPAVAFGADEKCYFDRRAKIEIPREFTDHVDRLFFQGGQLPDFAPAVDRVKAMRAVRALMSSFAPAHEAKTSTVAYALWVWSTPEVCVPETETAQP